MKKAGKPSCVVIGGGGHASVIIETLKVTGVARLHGILDRTGNAHREVQIVLSNGVEPRCGEQLVNAIAVGE